MFILKVFFLINFCLICLAQDLTEEMGLQEEGQENTGTAGEEEEIWEGAPTMGQNGADNSEVPEEIITIDVETNLGTVRGRVMDTVNGYSMRTFLSIPYAQTPPMRFEKPLPLTNFTDDDSVYESLEYKPSCPRWGPDSKTMDPTSSEDCLYLKIITPAEPECCLPVMFWLQGGGFNDGAINMYDNHALGDNFVSKGVIVVQVAYREGALGFFTTGTDEAAGNYAVYDALEALRFVKANIQAFGGNPNMITIMGQEAGAVMAELLTLSPLAYGLYSSVILMDGTAFDPSIFMNDKINVQRSQMLALAVGCDDSEDMLWDSDDRSAVLDCLKNSVDIEDLVSAIGRDEISEQMPGSFSCNYYWRPRYDGFYGVLPNTFDNLASGRPRVPTMIGVAHRDWLMELIPSIMVSNDNILPEDFNETYNTPEFAEQTCEMVLGDLKEIYDSDEYVQNMTDLCVEKYVTESMKDVDSPYFWLHRAARIGTGLHLMAPINVSVEHMKRQNNYRVYLYSFDYDRSSTGDHFWMATGAGRGLEIALVENFFPTFMLNDQDFQVLDSFSNMLTNFAKYHNPTPADSLTDGQQRWTNYLTGYYAVDEPDAAKMMDKFYVDDVALWIANGALDEYNDFKNEYEYEDEFGGWI